MWSTDHRAWTVSSARQAFFHALHGIKRSHHWTDGSIATIWFYISRQTWDLPCLKNPHLNSWFFRKCMTWSYAMLSEFFRRQKLCRSNVHLPCLTQLYDPPSNRMWKSFLLVKHNQVLWVQYSFVFERRTMAILSLWRNVISVDSKNPVSQLLILWWHS